jgi:hypothetical protein
VVLYSRQCGIGAFGPSTLPERRHPGEVALVADPDVLESLRIFRVGEELPCAELRRPLEGHTVFTFRRPLALQIRIAPRRARAPRAFAIGLRGTRLRRQLNRYRNRRRANRQHPDHSSFHVIAPERVYGQEMANLNPRGGRTWRLA